MYVKKERAAGLYHVYFSMKRFCREAKGKKERINDAKETRFFYITNETGWHLQWSAFWDDEARGIFFFRISLSILTLHIYPNIYSSKPTVQLYRIEDRIANGPLHLIYPCSLIVTNAYLYLVLYGLNDHEIVLQTSLSKRE